MKARITRSTDFVKGLNLPRIGKIKIGMLNDRGFPQSVDYFIPSGKYAALFSRAYGDKPQTIQIVFPDDNPELVCIEQYEYRDNEGRRIAYGDGKDFYVWSGERYELLSIEKYPNLMNTVSKRYPNKNVEKGGDGWKITLTLNFIIPMIRGIVGYWTFSTNGTLSTIPQIRDVFDGMLAVGKCKGVIFDLNVQFAKTQKPGDKSRFPVVSLIPNESEENVNKIKEAIKPIKEISDDKI